MQDFSNASPEIVNSMKASLSAPRFSRYLSECGGNEEHALRLYQWNSLVSQSLYVYMQSWEVCLRNKLNDFLCWKYNASWPYDASRAVRNLKSDDQRRLTETIRRQQQARGVQPVSTNIIVADLSAGFWVSLLSSKYDVPYKWRYNLSRVFPHDKSLDRAAAWEICDGTLNLRNRIAHHEPIFHLPLVSHYRDIQRVVAAMCPGTYAFADANCTFRHVLSHRPTK